MKKKVNCKEKVDIKDKFRQRYEHLTEWSRFIDVSLSFLRRSIRVNTLKISVEEAKARLSCNWKLTPIPWCSEGFWVEHNEGRRDIGNTTEHMLGYIYVQESASMIPPVVLGPKPDEHILDMCASPGSKATQIAMYMKGTGVLIANDYKGDRLKALGINMQRCGITNTAVTLMRGHTFKGVEFDRVLVDAPCSGTGTIRKSFKTLRMWNPNMVKRLAGTQRQLIQTGFDILREGGTMVYSTCTLEPEEDEAVVDFLLSNNDNAKLERINIDLKRGEPVLEFEGSAYSPDVKKCLRIWPQDNDTEGFFVAKIIKSG